MVHLAWGGLWLILLFALGALAVLKARRWPWPAVTVTLAGIILAGWACFTQYEAVTEVYGPGRVQTWTSVISALIAGTALTVAARLRSSR